MAICAECRSFLRKLPTVNRMWWWIRTKNVFPHYPSMIYCWWGSIIWFMEEDFWWFLHQRNIAIRCFQFIHKICSLTTQTVRQLQRRKSINTHMSRLQIITLSLLLLCHQTVLRVPFLCLDTAILNENSNSNSESMHESDSTVEEDAKSYILLALFADWMIEIFFFFGQSSQVAFPLTLHFLLVPLGSSWWVKFLWHFHGLLNGHACPAIVIFPNWSFYACHAIITGHSRHTNGNTCYNYFVSLTDGNNSNWGSWFERPCDNNNAQCVNFA